MNFFRPVRKLVGKVRQRTKVVKRYDEPRTYHRLLDARVLSETHQAEIDKHLLALNPAELQRQIDQTLHELWEQADGKRGRKLASVG